MFFFIKIIKNIKKRFFYIYGQGIVMDYVCTKFRNFSFSRFGFIVRTDRQTDRFTEADQRYTHATTVGVSNN